MTKKELSDRFIEAQNRIVDFLDDATFIAIKNDLDALFSIFEETLLHYCNDASNDANKPQIELSDAILERVETLINNAVDARLKELTQRIDTHRKLIDELETKEKADCEELVKRMNCTQSDFNGLAISVNNSFDTAHAEFDKLRERIDALENEAAKDFAAIVKGENNGIDWEQCRYETAKDCLQFAADYDNVDYYQEDVAKCVKLSIAYADELIKQLKS